MTYCACHRSRSCANSCHDMSVPPTASTPIFAGGASQQRCPRHGWLLPRRWASVSVPRCRTSFTALQAERRKPEGRRSPSSAAIHATPRGSRPEQPCEASMPARPRQRPHKRPTSSHGLRSNTTADAGSGATPGVQRQARAIRASHLMGAPGPEAKATTAHDV